MLPASAPVLRVALFANAERQGGVISQVLGDHGMTVCLSEIDVDRFIDRISRSGADIVIVDVGESDEADVVDQLLELSDLPILFNDSSHLDLGSKDARDDWGRKLVAKVRAMIGVPVAREEPQPPPVAKPAPRVAAPAVPISSRHVDPSALVRNPAAARTVWVLGASLGGPQAVRQFLEQVSPELPVAFVLVQHIGANHVELLAQQMNRITPFHVMPAASGQLVKHREVYTAPADASFTITGDGHIELRPAPERVIYSPSIDLVMTEVARRYGSNSGCIVFSGMGDDGSKGCRDIARAGGIVWAQNTESCVVSSMPDHARLTQCVTYSATPALLAQHLCEYYCG